ncbi:hypothetical protein FOL47_001404, partial [Perkinsus chesapeaki]
ALPVPIFYKGMTGHSVKVYQDDIATSSEETIDRGVVNEQMQHGISIKTFFFTCCNTLISQALSVPFMFTTAGWVAFITQALAAVLAFICIQLVRIALRNERVVDYAEQKGIPPFEREYTFLGEFCAGSLGRVGMTLLIFIEYFTGLATNLAAIGLCAELLLSSVRAEVWIVIFAGLTLALILVPWLREISAVLGGLAVIGIVGSMVTWVGSAFAISPTSHFVENFPPREPLLVNLVTAFSLSMWTSADVPSLPPYLGAVKGTTNRRISVTLILCLTLSVVYVYIIGMAGMQVCDGVCHDFYPGSLAGMFPALIPTWLVYSLYIFLLVRMFVIMPILMVPLMVSSETIVGSVLAKSTTTSKLMRFKYWRFIVRCLIMICGALGAILAKAQLAYFQAIASTILTS